MIKAADTDGSGVVEFQEFMDMICDQMEVFSMFVWNLRENIIFPPPGHRRGNRGGIQDVWPRQLRLHQPQRGEVSSWVWPGGDQFYYLER